MNMKSEAVSALFAKLALGVATASTLAGAGALIKATEINAVQESRLGRVEESLQKIEDLDESLESTATEVALLRAELEAERRDPSD